jgi:hypothetical protein
MEVFLKLQWKRGRMLLAVRCVPYRPNQWNRLDWACARCGGMCAHLCAVGPNPNPKPQQ